MSGTRTARLLRAYEQMGQPMMFLSGLFVSPPENFHTTEEVEIDVVRSDEDISIIVQDLSTGYRYNSEDLYTNKGFIPPVYKEAIPINSFDLIKRMPGQDPFQSPDFRANVIQRMFKGMLKIENKIRRGIELQAAQALQTGIITLTDANGVALYVLDFKPKVTHFPTVSISWGTAGDDISGDLESLIETIRNDGLMDVDQLIFGSTAFEKFISNDNIQKRFDNRRMELGRIVPMEMRGGGGIYRGVVEIGNYSLDVWTYGGRYKDPVTSQKVQFLDPDKVIVRASMGRLDVTFGAVPNIGSLLGASRNNLIPEMPGRMSSTERSIDLYTNIWITDDGEQLLGGVAARPLCILTGIDTAGCLKTVV